MTNTTKIQKKPQLFNLQEARKRVESNMQQSRKRVQDKISQHKQKEQKNKLQNHMKIQQNAKSQKEFQKSAKNITIEQNQLIPNINTNSIIKKSISNESLKRRKSYSNALKKESQITIENYIKKPTKNKIQTIVELSNAQTNSNSNS